MALNRTTLAAAVGVDDKAVLLSSISNLAPGHTLLIDDEAMRVLELPPNASIPVPVLRGINGTAVKAHVSGAAVVLGYPFDFEAPRIPRRRDVRSYSASGAIELPQPGHDMVAILNGTNALAMTLANPSEDNDGDVLTVVGNGKAAHTITYSPGFGDAGSSYDVLTYASGGRCASQFIAVNGRWVVLPSPMGGTTTNIQQAIA